jgi:hypothetical protein
MSSWNKWYFKHKNSEKNLFILVKNNIKWKKSILDTIPKNRKKYLFLCSVFKY